ncbi:unnamed protein product [Symbiodinium sp. CCMP2456]|nr:unnamed protein product [Symbiodinium sp. CCMP2456]
MMLGSPSKMKMSASFVPGDKPVRIRGRLTGHMWKLNNNVEPTAKNLRDISSWRRRLFLIEDGEGGVAMMYLSEKEDGLMVPGAMLRGRKKGTKSLSRLQKIEALPEVVLDPVADDMTYSTMNNIKQYEIAFFGGQVTWTHDGQLLVQRMSEAFNFTAVSSLSPAAYLRACSFWPNSRLMLVLVMPAMAIVHNFARQGLEQSISGQKQADDIRFLSLIGTEGSGHHLLTPVLRKVMNMTLVDLRGVGPARHISQASFVGGEDVFNAFMANDASAFHEALLQHQSGDLIQQAYSFPTKFHHRSADSRLFDLSGLYQMLDSAGVSRKAVIRYERDLGDCARSVFKRWPDLCEDNLKACEAQQEAFNKVIETSLETLNNMQVPILRIGIAQLQQNCHKVGRKLLQFFRDANMLLPDSPWHQEDEGLNVKTLPEKLYPMRLRWTDGAGKEQQILVAAPEDVSRKAWMVVIRTSAGMGMAGHAVV